MTSVAACGDRARYHSKASLISAREHSRPRWRPRSGRSGIEAIPQTPREHDALLGREGFEGGRSVDLVNEDGECSRIRPCRSAASIVMPAHLPDAASVALPDDLRVVAPLWRWLVPGSCIEQCVDASTGRSSGRPSNPSRRPVPKYPGHYLVKTVTTGRTRLHHPELNPVYRILRDYSVNHVPGCSLAIAAGCDSRDARYRSVSCRRSTGSLGCTRRAR